MRIRAAFAVGLTLALASGQAAQACSQIVDPDYNQFADVGFTPGADVIGRAQSVDWAIVEAPTLERCAPEEQITPSGRRFWRLVPHWRWLNRLLAHLPVARETGTCNGKTVHGLIAPLRARVIERISGSGPKVYPLWSEVRPDAVEWNLLKDDRTVADWGGGPMPTAYPDLALARHRGNAFLDHGWLRTQREPGGCGGGPIAHVGHRYLIFRDARGSILTAVQVAYADDALLVRLRRHAGHPQLFAHPTLPVDDFVRASDGVALVRIRQCEREGFRIGDASLERGDRTAIAFGLKPQKGSIFPEMAWLADQLARTGQTCRIGDQVLVLKSPWAEGRWPDDYPRAAVIHNGMIRPRDFLTGFTLTGPAEVRLDQVNAWVAEGKTARSAAH